MMRNGALFHKAAFVFVASRKCTMPTSDFWQVTNLFERQALGLNSIVPPKPLGQYPYATSATNSLKSDLITIMINITECRAAWLSTFFSWNFLKGKEWGLTWNWDRAVCQAPPGDQIIAAPKEPSAVYFHLLLQNPSKRFFPHSEIGWLQCPVTVFF